MKRFDKIAKEIFKTKILETGEYNKIRSTFINLNLDKIKTTEGIKVTIKLLTSLAKNLKTKGNVNPDDAMTVMKIKAVESEVYKNIKTKSERLYLTDKIVSLVYLEMIKDIRNLKKNLKEQIIYKESILENLKNKLSEQEK